MGCRVKRTTGTYGVGMVTRCPPCTPDEFRLDRGVYGYPTFRTDNSVVVVVDVTIIMVDGKQTCE